MRTSARKRLLLFLRKEQCQGCTHCMRICPTEAIRIRRGKAQVMNHRCVQCGQCIKACPRGAWEVQGDSLETIKGKGKAMAVLDPTVFWQFGGQTVPQRVAEAFLKIGFGAVQDMGEALEVYGGAVTKYLSSGDKLSPAITSTCPAVVQLVQVKYPSLLENLIPIISPLQILARRQKEFNRRNSPTHSYYIVPCLAQALAANDLLAAEGKPEGIIVFTEVFNLLKAVADQKKSTIDASPVEESFFNGMRWAAAGAANEALGTEGSLLVDGIHLVAGIMELAESGLLKDVPLLEAWACVGGCLGGPFTVQNPFLARYHLQAWMRQNETKVKRERKGGKLFGEMASFQLSSPLGPRPGMRLDENLKVAMEKLHRIDELVKKFPGIDCGSCGSPNCLALAEDVVQGQAQEGDCLYAFKEKARPEGREP